MMMYGPYYISFNSYMGCPHCYHPMHVAEREPYMTLHCPHCQHYSYMDDYEPDQPANEEAWGEPD